MTLAFQVTYWATHILEVTFFVGLAGCASVVILSWISILKEAFSEDD